MGFMSGNRMAVQKYLILFAIRKIEYFQWLDYANGMLTVRGLKLVFTIITKEARDSLKHIHLREPVILTKKAVKSWITVNEPQNKPLNLLQDNLDGMISYPVDSYVNTSSNDGVKCISQLN